MVESYTETFEIKVAHCDMFGRLKADELFKLMQECATVHAELMGVGMEAMHRLNRTFVLSRVKVNVLRTPFLCETISIKTYPAGIERLFYIRDFEISIGEVKAAEARTLWLVIDLDTRRPVRDRGFGSDFPKYVNENVVMENPVKPRLPDGAGLAAEYRVGYSDVDILGHANNSRYIAWTCDCLGPGFFSEGLPFSLTVNFSSELSEGECVRIYGKETAFCGKGESGRESFTALAER